MANQGWLFFKRPQSGDYGLANVPPITRNVVAETNFSRVRRRHLYRPLPKAWKHETTPLSQQPTSFVTITHPYHPWSGQQVEIIYVRRGVDPDLLVQRPDGRHVIVAMSWTDYASPPGDKLRASPPHLLDVSGLRQMACLIDRIRQEKSPP